MDHLILALVKDMLPTYEDCHKWQMLGMQGPNLAEKRQKTILAHAPETPLEQIKEINESHFKVQLTSFEKIYEVNLLSYMYTYSDFPRILLCKHIAAAMHFFWGGIGTKLGPQAPDNGTSEAEPDKAKSLAQQNGNTGKAKTCASITSITNNIVSLAWEILLIAPADPEIAKSLQMAQSQLNAVLLSAKDNRSQLHEKEQITPN